MAISLQPFGNNAEYIKIAGSGKNALDFHIAYWIRKLAEQDPKSYFHIVSKDTGFDPLIKYLRKNKILAQRVSIISEIQILNGIANGSHNDKINSIANSLRLRGASKPRKRQTLINSISAMFMKTLNESEINDLIKSLEKKGLISVTEDVVTYNLQEANLPENIHPAKSPN